MKANPIDETTIATICGMFTYREKTGAILRNYRPKGRPCDRRPLNDEWTVSIYLPGSGQRNITTTMLAWLLVHRRMPAGRVQLRSKGTVPKVGRDLRPDNLRDCGVEIEP